MNKLEAVQQIRAARRAHLSWVMKANALIQGIPLDKEQVPISSKDCKFGRWYRAAGKEFINIPGFKDIYQPHEELHRIYNEIFNLLIPEEQSGMLAKLFGSKPTVSQKNLQRAKEMFQLLKNESDAVVGVLDKLEAQID